MNEVHGCARVKCNDRASRRFMRVHAVAHRLVQTSPRTQLLVRRAAIVNPARGGVIWNPRRRGCQGGDEYRTCCEIAHRH